MGTDITCLGTGDEADSTRIDSDFLTSNLAVVIPILLTIFKGSIWRPWWSLLM